MYRGIRKAINVVLLIILIPILFISSVILIDSVMHKDEVPSFFGWKMFIVLTDSMKPEIQSGDLVIVKECKIEEIKSNDIVAFKENETVITHRILGIENENGKLGYITKGDNNEENQEVVYSSQIEGKYKYKVNKLGNFVLFIQTPIGMVACLSIPLILLLIVQINDSEKSKKYIIEEESNEKKLKKEEKLSKEKEELMKK